MVALLFAIPIICALIGIVWGIDIVRSDETPNVVAGHVLAGIGLVCASLVALVASVVRQIQNTYSEADRRFWPWLVIIMGTIDILWGLYLLSSCWRWCGGIPIPSPSAFPSSRC